MTPSTLSRADISARVPHRGRMCLLDRLDRWSATEVCCSTATHHDPANPLLTATGLLSPAAIEYAAQAMALHGSLLAPRHAGASPGYLASVRDVAFSVGRLDTVSGDLQVIAQRLAGDDLQILYRFTVKDAEGRALASGRATVVLNTPLP
jgi:predicted hotdog family 3-hydroxylacyl-ACP dehydratase